MAGKKSSQSDDPDGFTITPDEAYSEQQRELTLFLAEVRENSGNEIKPSKLETANRLLTKPKEVQILALLAAMNRMMWLCLQRNSLPKYAETNADLKLIQAHELLQNSLSELISTLSGRKLPLTEEHLRQILDIVVTGTRKDGNKGPLFDLLQTPIPGVLPLLVGELETRFRESGVPGDLRPRLEQLELILREFEFWAGYKKTLARLQPLL